MMKRTITALMIVATPAAAIELRGITSDNCAELFSGAAVEACLSLAAEAELFALKDYRGETGDDPWLVWFMAKEGTDINGNRLEVTTWGASANEAMLEAAATLDKLKRGEW